MRKTAGEVRNCTDQQVILSIILISFQVWCHDGRLLYLWTIRRWRGGRCGGGSWGWNWRVAMTVIVADSDVGMNLKRWWRRKRQLLLLLVKMQVVLLCEFLCTVNCKESSWWGRSHWTRYSLDHSSSKGSCPSKTRDCWSFKQLMRKQCERWAQERQDKSVRMWIERTNTEEEEESMDESRRGLQFFVARRERRVYSDRLVWTIASFSVQLSFIFGQKEQEEWYM